jgi:hypothetical protein
MQIDQPVALAHIDGDWYESVMTCLQRIEPHLSEEGILVIDDYDAWSGCRTAVDEYFADKKTATDSSARLACTSSGADTWLSARGRRITAILCSYAVQR